MLRRLSKDPRWTGGWKQPVPNVAPISVELSDMKAISLSLALALTLIPVATGQDGYERKSADNQTNNVWEAAIRGVSG